MEIIVKMYFKKIKINVRRFHVQIDVDNVINQKVPHDLDKN